MNEGFKLVCLNCNRETVIDKNNKLDDMNGKEITGFLEMNDDFEVECECGNKIIIN